MLFTALFAILSYTSPKSANLQTLAKAAFFTAIELPWRAVMA